MCLDETRAWNILRSQIKYLITTLSYENHIFADISIIANICEKIFTVFTHLTAFTLCEASYRNCTRLAFNGTSLRDFRSSMLLTLKISVVDFEDCLRLLDGRFDQLHTLFVDMLDVCQPLDIVNEVSFVNEKIQSFMKLLRSFLKGNLPNLRCFSLSCTEPILGYDQTILPLLYRMANLEQLHLYITVLVIKTLIDGNQLQVDIINHMPRLNHFAFFIHSSLYYYKEVNYPSTEDISICTCRVFT